jgi:hypothetical protein
MRKLLFVATCLCLSALWAVPTGTQQAVAQEQTARFVCLAPVGHVCQFSVRTAAGPIDFALPSGERREVVGVAARSDKYCVCDPGPVTPDCKEPRLDHWCLGDWLDVSPGLNSRIDTRENLFARR